VAFAVVVGAGIWLVNAMVDSAGSTIVWRRADAPSDA
jgi:hypothetical protein